MSAKESQVREWIQEELEDIQETVKAFLERLGVNPLTTMENADTVFEAVAKQELFEVMKNALEGKAGDEFFEVLKLCVEEYEHRLLGYRVYLGSSHSRGLVIGYTHQALAKILYTLRFRFLVNCE